MRNLLFRLPALALIGLALHAASPDVVINQVYGGGGNSGSVINRDFVELYNTSSSSVTMTNWTLWYASSTGAFGSNKHVFSGTIQPHSYFLLEESYGGSGSAPASNLPTADAVGTLALAASSGKVALTQGGVTLSVACPTSGLVDLVGYGAANCSETADAPTLSNTAAITRNASHLDTDNNSTDFALLTPPNPHNSAGATALIISSLNPPSATAGGGQFTLTVNGLGFSAPATVNFNGSAILADAVTASQITATIPASAIASPGTDPVTVTSGGRTSNSVNFSVGSAPTCTPTATIAQIQGSGDTSPLVNSTATFTGIVTHLRSNGFFAQMPGAGDGDPTTSDAVYIFTSSTPVVSVGDSVCVSGSVTEYSGGDATDPSNSLTEIGTPTVSRLSSGNALPAAITINPNPAGAFDQLERYEGMRVQITDATVTGPTGGSLNEPASTESSNGGFYVVATGDARPFREPGLDVSHPIAATAPGTIPRFDSNPEVVEVYTGDPGVTKVDVADGADVTGISGVLDVYFGGYELDTDPSATLTVSNNNLTYTAVPAGLASQLTIGTFNMERFYDTSDDPNTQDVVLTPAAFQSRLLKASLAIRNVLNMPDILGVEEMENLTTLQAVSAQISSDAIAAGQTDPQYQAYLVSGNDIGGINVGFLVKEARVSNVTATQYGKDATYTDPNTSQQATLNDRPPLVLTGTVHNGSDVGLPVTVIANHLKALPADDPSDSRVRVKRNAQAVYLANLIQSFQTANPGALVVSLGDYNAFEFNDGTADVLGVVEGNPVPASQVLVAPSTITNPTLTELSSALLPANQRYSYVENGNAQQLDHIVVNSNAWSRVTSFAIAHLNADFPVIYRNDSTRPERISDHDPEVAYLALPGALDVTSSVSISSSAFVLNRATGLYSTTVTVRNTSAATITSQIQVALSSIPAGMTLTNPSGNLGGTPYISAPASSLAPGASTSVTAQFRLAGAVKPNVTFSVYAGTL